MNEAAYQALHTSTLCCHIQHSIGKLVAPSCNSTHVRLILPFLQNCLQVEDAPCESCRCFLLMLLGLHCWAQMPQTSSFKVCSPLTCLFAVQDIVTEAQENEEDPTAGLLRGAECNVCMNRPVQVSNCTWCVYLGFSMCPAAARWRQTGAMLLMMFALHCACSLALL